jgi:hypothetical protein
MNTYDFDEKLKCNVTLENTPFASYLTEEITYLNNNRKGF